MNMAAPRGGRAALNRAALPVLVAAGCGARSPSPQAAARRSPPPIKAVCAPAARETRAALLRLPVPGAAQRAPARPGGRGAPVAAHSGSPPGGPHCDAAPVAGRAQRARPGRRSAAGQSPGPQKPAGLRALARLGSSGRASVRASVARCPPAARGCLSLGGGPLLRRAGGKGPRKRGPGGVKRPPRAGAVRGWLVPSIAIGSTRPRQAGQRPGLDSRRLRRSVKSKGQRPKFASRGLDILHYSWYDDATDSSSIRHNEIATIHGLRAVVGPPVECCYHSAWVAFLLPKVHILWAVATVARPP